MNRHLKRMRNRNGFSDAVASGFGKKKKRSLAIEALESRVMFALDLDLPCDVDGSGLVEPLDALILINALNRSTPWGPIPDDTLNALRMDVNRDGVLSPLDPLLVINAINRNQGELLGNISVDIASDSNNNGVVVRPQVRFVGQTGSFANIAAQTKPKGSTTYSSPLNVTSDRNGVFQFEISLQNGINDISVAIRDELGRTMTIGHELRLGDVVADWNAAMLNVVRDWTGTSNDPYPNRIVPSQPPLVARNLAMMHTAMFDAINAIEGKYESYAFEGPLQPHASAESAIAWAAYTVGSALYSDHDERSVWDASLAESLAVVPEGSARDAGRLLGLQAAQAVLAKRQGDLSTQAGINLESTQPGKWRRTAPDYLPPLLPQWANLRPFAMHASDQFLSSPPPSLDSAEYAEAVDEVMRLGGIGSAQRTREQTEIATFWADGAGTATPPGHWNRIATDAIQSSQIDLLASARTMALLNIAMADAGIASWNTKYHYNLWRPIDAIRLADQDGNDSTQPDPLWTPFLKTPPFAAYTSGHSSFSSAAATVLTEILGDDFAFTDTSDPYSGLSQRPLDPSLILRRSFGSFWDAAHEAGNSRIYGGIHFSFDKVAGQQAGRSVGEWTLAHALKFHTMGGTH